MRRGEIWLVDLDPVLGDEANKTRPAVIVTNDGANAAARRRSTGLVSIVPLTSNVAAVRPFHVLLPAGESGLRSDSKALCEQLRVVSPLRLRHRIGAVPLARMRRLDDALRLQLGL